MQSHGFLNHGPFHMQKVEDELDRLQREGVITRYIFRLGHAHSTDSQTSSVRICGDYTVTINGVAKLETYPLPKIEDLFTGGTAFSKLDLSHAYQQIVVHEDFRQYTTINTHSVSLSGLHLPLQYSNALVVVYLDDILVSGKDADIHL